MFDFLKILDPLARLKETYPKVFFESLGLPPDVIPHGASDLPLIEGLIKPTFQNYKALLKLWCTKSLLYRFEKEAPRVEKPVVLFTWVMNDGLGDLATQMDAATLIKEAFPNIDLHLVTLITKEEAIFSGHQESTFHRIDYEGLDLAKIPSQLIDLMRRASLVIQMPTIYPGWDLLLKAITLNNPHPPEIISVGEYGFIDSHWFHPESGHLCMGLHSLEQGLLLPKIPLGKICDFYFAYLKSERGYAIYLHTLLQLHDDSEESLKIIFVSPLPLLKVLTHESWRDYKLKEIVFIDGIERAVLPIGEGNKRLILEKVGHHLSPKAAQSLLESSKPFVGCRGDRSFSEVISAKKPFFYDAPKHAEPFLKDLLSIARKEFFAFPALESYLKLLLDRTSPPKELGKALANLLKDRSMLLGMDHLFTFLQTRCSFNRSFLNLIKEKTIHHFSDEQKKGDLTLVEAFLSEAIGLKSILSHPASLSEEGHKILGTPPK